MLALRRLLVGAVLVAVPVSAGCLVPQSQLNALKTQNRALAERVHAQEAEIANLKVHSENTLNLLEQAEEDLALLETKAGLDRRQLENFRAEREELHENVQGLVNAKNRVTPEVRNQLAQLSERYESLTFDPNTGVSKFDFDILFDEGRAELKPGAEEVLGELVQVLKTPAARDMRVLVVGHTDSKQVARKPARDLYSDNFDLSTARANAVGKALRKLGLGEERIGEAGFADHQPVAPNVSEVDRRKNRRVEIFVMAPSVPVIGWTETVPTLY